MLKTLVISVACGHDTLETWDEAAVDIRRYMFHDILINAIRCSVISTKVPRDKANVHSNWKRHARIALVLLTSMLDHTAHMRL